MSITERLSQANVRNRLEKCNLEAELKRIDRAKKTEIRMHNNETYRFRAKYSKSSLMESVTEASDVKMYITHNPGFCYKRNGKQKIAQSAATQPVLDFEKLHDLLFTDGEIDVEKVLCLHLLSTHRTETLKPPPCLKGAFKFVSKENSPLERLIERSKLKYKKPEYVFTKMLPTYILDIRCTGSTMTNTEESEESVLINDGRLAARLIVNDKIAEIINTVMSALQESNAEKMHKIISYSEDEGSLKKIFHKPNILTFINSLKTYPLITSCESYFLTPKFKIKPTHLEIRTNSGQLENLIVLIRMNVLQLPSKTQWKALYENDEDTNQVLEEELDKSLRVESKASITPSKTSYRRKLDFSTLSETSEPPNKREFMDYDTKKTFGRKNFIEKNIKEVSNYRRNFYNEDDSMSTITIRSSNTFRRRSYTPSILGDILENPMLPSKAELVFSKSDHQKQSTIDENSQDSTNEKLEKSLKQDEKDSNSSIITALDVKSYIQQTKCPACMEKWKKPLPLPKTPRIKRETRTGSHETSHSRATDPFKTHSANRISALIKQEEYNLESYDRKYSEGTSRHFKTDDSTSKKFKVECILLSAIDLEKIKQEIKEKETQKKLSTFLNNLV